MSDTSYSSMIGGKIITIQYDRSESDTKPFAITPGPKISFASRAGKSSITKALDFSKIRERETYIKINQRLGD